LRTRLAAVGVVVALAAGVGAGLWRAAGDDDHERPIEVRSTGAAFTSLDEMVAASDVVVIARALAVAPGRSFVTEDGSGIRSQVVTLEVGRVLAGADPGPTIGMEEEAATADGRPVEVDGLRPTAAGDQGIFFLVSGDDPDVPYFATVSTAGRYLRASTEQGDDELLGADLPLARELAALGGSALTDRILAAGSSASCAVPTT
jgi:hypothetical protein